MRQCNLATHAHSRYQPQPHPQHCTALHSTAQRRRPTHHDTREVDGGHAVEQKEEGGISEGAEAEQQARGRQQRGNVQVCEVGGPGGGLVLCGEGRQAADSTP